MHYINISDYQKNKYKKIVEVIFELSSTFKIIDPCGALNIEKLDIYQNLVNIKRSNKWAGTRSSGRKAYIYSFKTTNISVDFFKKKDSFFHRDDDCFYNTGFDFQCDHSFHEKDDRCIMYVTSHEGEVFLRKDIHAKYWESIKSNV